MPWKYDSENHCVINREEGLYLVQPGQSRDNFEYKIIKLHDHSVTLRFFLKGATGSDELTPEEAKQHPECSRKSTWLIEKHPYSEAEREMIFQAIDASTHWLDGFALDTNRNKVRSLILFKYVDRLEGY